MSPKTTSQNESLRQKSRENIMTAALKLFSRNGYAQTSIRMIAEEANVSLGLMYNYFKSKEEMLLAILKEMFQDLDAVFSENKPQTPGEQFASTVDDFFNMISRNKEKLRMMAQMGLHQNKFDLANTLTKRKYEESVTKISGNLAALGYSETSVAVEARMIVAILDGLTFEYLLMDESIPVREVKDHLISKYTKTKKPTT